MRLCRYQNKDTADVALYLDDMIVPVNTAANELKIRVPNPNHNILDYLPPDGRNAQAALQLETAFRKLPAADQRRLSRPMKEVRLKVPVPDPKKAILLAGNYAAHIIEGGGKAPER